VTGLVIEGRVREARVDPLLRDRRRRWLITVGVSRVIEGEPAGLGDELTLLVHSPSRDFADPEIVGRSYRLTLLDPPDEPYTGRFNVAPATTG